MRWGGVNEGWGGGTLVSGPRSFPGGAPSQACSLGAGASVWSIAGEYSSQVLGQGYLIEKT